MRRLMLATFLTFMTLLLLLVATKAQEPVRSKPREDDMSAMGRRAYAQAQARARSFLKRRALIAADNDVTPPTDIACDDNGCDTGGGEEDIGSIATQSETTIAVDPTGIHVVVGFNDFRQAANNPATSAISISGYAYSDDGGVTWTDGGQLPVTSNGKLPNGVLLPQVSGDPDIKNVGGCKFIYSSILVAGYPASAAPNFAGTAQTMSIHRSVDCGHTWSGPYEVTAATNPHGTLSGSNAFDAADKEFIDVSSAGRVLISWTNFTSAALSGTAGLEIRTAYSDDIMTGNPPTWSAGVVLNPGSSTADTGSIPSYARNGSNRVYVAWNASSLSTLSATIRVSTSTDNGVTWLPPVTLASFFPIDQILGNDRVNSFPGMGIGPEGNVYVAYANNNNRDGSDIAFQRSTDGGASFSSPVFLNSRPGFDRSQWFPAVSVDQSNGRVYVIYYDQVGTSGDLTTARYTYSGDGGNTFSPPSALMSNGCVGVGTDPLDCRTFHAGFGNDTSQPNLGDYIGATTANGDLIAAWAGTYRQGSFVDGQPTPFFTTPDVYTNRVNTAKAALTLGSMSVTDTGGNHLVDAGDQISLQLPLFNFVTNPVTGAVTYTNVTGILSSSTPGVTVLVGTRTYPNIAPGATQPNTSPYVYRVSPAFTPGTKIEFSLDVITGQGAMTLLFSQSTGTPVATTIFAENFDGTSVGSLPPGWATIHAGGANTVPWTTNNAFCGTTSNALFHINANDGPGTNGSNQTRFERVASPNITIPANAQYVTLDFDICYDTEEDSNFNIQAFDGADLRITDFSTGHVARANFMEAFADSIMTGSLMYYPRHNVRSSNANYLQDISLWSGDSQGFKHVSMVLPGMQGTTVQLRPDFTQDGSLTCTNLRPTHTLCGVSIDNIVMKSVVTKSDELARITLTPVAGSPGVYSGVVTSQALAGAGGIAVNLTGSVSSGTITVSSPVVTIPAGSQTSPSFQVTVNPAASGTTGNVTAIGPSNSKSAGITIL